VARNGEGSPPRFAAVAVAGRWSIRLSRRGLAIIVDLLRERPRNMSVP
jgi:hypothetical protein